MIAILLADGFEEIEALTPVDVLRRAGLDAKTVAIGSKIAVGSHGIPVVCDISSDEVKLGEVSSVVFPGGMPGSLNLDAAEFTDKIIAAVNEKGGLIAAICAAPLVLGRRGLLEGKRATCYPGFENELRGAAATGASVEVDGNTVTARGMGVALEFSLKLVEILKSKDEAEKIADGICTVDPRSQCAAISEKDFEEFEEFEDPKNECPSCAKGAGCGGSPLSDNKFLTAVKITLDAGYVSSSLLQRKLGIGYGKASRFIDTMEDLGVIGGMCGRHPRPVLITEEEWQKKLEKIRSEDGDTENDK